MDCDGFRTLRVDVDEGIARVTLDHPPINLLDAAMIGDLDRLSRELEGDREVRVVLFESADPEFFIAHADVELLLRSDLLPPPPSEGLGGFHRMVERFRRLPQATLAAVEGIARGGGSEFLLALDMRFAALESAVFGQPEVAVGILPGGGGTQRLPRLVGRGRALEIVLGAGDFDAATAERYGWINRAFPRAALRPAVRALARRIASHPREAVALAKQAVLAGEAGVEEGLRLEAQLFDRLLRSDEAGRRMRAFLAAGGQTREIERRSAETLFAGPPTGSGSEPEAGRG